MAISITAQSSNTGEYPLIDEGDYRAEVVGLEPVTGGQFGDAIRISFRILDDEQYDGEEITGMASAKLSVTPEKESKLYLWWHAITGGTLADGEAVADLEADLVGQACKILVGHRTSSKGSVFANVVGVTPDRRARRTNGQRTAPVSSRRRQPEPVGETEDLVPF